MDTQCTYSLVPSLENPDHEKIMQSIQKWRSNLSSKVLPIGKQAVQSNGSKQKEKLYDLLDELEHDVIGPFLCGNAPTIADCAAFPFMWRLDKEEGGLQPNLKAWVKACESRPDFGKTVQSSWWWWW